MNPYEQVKANSQPPQVAENNPSQEQSQLQEERHQQEARVRSARCEALAENEDFKWFLSECVAPLVIRERNNALDVGLSVEKRNEAAHRHDIAGQILGLLETERHYWANQAAPVS